MKLLPALCPVCERDDCIPIAVGADFEYETSNEEFLAVRCKRCGLVYLNPQPDQQGLSEAYPDSYHAFQFTPSEYGLVYRVRQRLESRRLLKWCRRLSDQARILDLGCGDGFHIELLKRFGNPNWTIEGVDSDPRALRGAQQRGVAELLRIGQFETMNLPAESYDLIFMIMTIEHLPHPLALLKEAERLLREGGRLVIVTDNTDSPDFAIFCNRHWGGYHFPRHLFLFNRKNLALICQKAGLETVRVSSALSPVNWTYSFRNWVQDWKGPNWLRDRFSLGSPIALGVFTILDGMLCMLGRGAILHGIFEKRSKAK